MKTANTTEAKKREDGSTELTITDALTGSNTKKRYLAIRGGISYPTAQSGAYFCVLGQERKKIDVMKNKQETGNLVLLIESFSEALSLRSWHGRLCDAATTMMCDEFYTLLPDVILDCGYTSDLEDFAAEQGCDLFVDDAPDSDNFLLGISRINSLIDGSRLVLPDASMIISELRSITRADLEGGHPEQLWPGINGLRHVISSFIRFPARIRHRYKMPPAPNPYY